MSAAARAADSATVRAWRMTTVPPWSCACYSFRNALTGVDSCGEHRPLGRGRRKTVMGGSTCSGNRPEGSCRGTSETPGEPRADRRDGHDSLDALRTDHHPDVGKDREPRANGRLDAPAQKPRSYLVGLVSREHGVHGWTRYAHREP